MLVPIKKVMSITLLPNDFDLGEIQYKIVDSQLICKTTKQEVPLKEEER